MAIGKSQMIPKIHKTTDTKVIRYGIIVAKTLLRDTIAEKTTQSRSRFKFISFIGRKRDKANTIEYSKRRIIWEFVIKQLKGKFLVSSK